MSSDIYAKPNLGHKARFNKKPEEDGSDWKEEEVYIYESADDVINNQTTSQLQDEHQQIQDQPEGKKKPPKSSTLCKTVLCIVVLAGIITLTTYFILENIKLNIYSQRLDGLLVNNSQLQKHLNQLEEEVKRLKNKTEENNSQIGKNSETLRIGQNLLQDKIKKLRETFKEKWCPEQWTRFGCSCYFRSTEKNSWTESRKFCQDRGADLVIINSREEQEFVADLNQNGDSWIGLRGSQSNGWGWVDGSPLTETFWETGWGQYYYNQWYATCCSDQRKWKHSHYMSKLNWICEK